MPLVFLAIGLAIIALGVRGQGPAAGSLLASEFTGQGSFIPWLLAIGILGGISSVRAARPAANGMIVLVIVAMFLAHGVGFFAKLQDAFKTATPAAKPATAGAQPTQATASITPPKSPGISGSIGKPAPDLWSQIWAWN